MVSMKNLSKAAAPPSKAAAVDALVAAGITSSKSDIQWLVAEIKKRESSSFQIASSKAAAASASNADGEEVVPPSPKLPTLTGKEATQATKEVFKRKHFTLRKHPNPRLGLHRHWRLSHCADAARLKYQDEDWKTRDEALVRLQKLICDGALSCDGFISGEAGYAANLKDLTKSLVAQLYDLRSVIVKSAVKTLEMLMADVCDTSHVHSRV